jgi:hypothetical protein
MNMKKILFFIMWVSAVMLIFSCEKDQTTDEDATALVADHEQAGDYVLDSKIVNITLKGTSISADSSSATVNGTTVTINQAGTYKITGTLADGQILVDATGIVKLVFAGINVTSSKNAPVFVKNAEKTIILLAENTSNYLEDASTYTNTSDEEPNAALFSKANLSIYGTGSLVVKANYNDGIASKDGLIIKNGNISVTAKDDAMRGKDYLVIEDGTFVITASGDGLKSDNDSNVSAGFVNIKGGSFKISAGDDGISALTNLLVTNGNFNITSGTVSTSSSSAKGVKGDVSVNLACETMLISAANDAIHSNGKVSINGGNYTLSSGDDGIHGNDSVTVNKGDILITKSYEGIEGAMVTINGGNIRLTSSDDGLNAASGGGGGAPGGFPGQASSSGNNFLYMNGGYLVVNSTGDGVDVNGSIVMTGGTLIVYGPTASDNASLDYDGSFKITGGTLAAAGSAGMAQSPGSSSSQNSALLVFRTTFAVNTLLHIEASDGTNILTIAPTKKYQCISISSPKLTTGTYSVYTGGSSTGTLTDGVYLNGTYTAGTKYSSFTVSGVTTKITL